MNKLSWNPLSGEFDYIGEPSTSGFSGEITSIPQENSDPSASPEEVWVLNNIGTFSFSYKTLQGTTKRVVLNLS